MTRAVVAFGSNLGDRVANLRAALAKMAVAGFAVERVSSAWETPPVPADQPSYLNAATGGEWAGDAPGLLAALQAIEYTLGRRPERRWGPRPMDLDILFFGDIAVDSPALMIPHPRIRERAFVLAPLAEVLSGPLPMLGRSALELLNETGLQGARRTGLLLGDRA